MPREARGPDRLCALPQVTQEVMDGAENGARVGERPGCYFSAFPAQSEMSFGKEVVTHVGKFTLSKLRCGLCPVADRPGRG